MDNDYKIIQEILTDAKAFIQKGWTKSYYACDVNGIDIEPTNPKACSWCANGAIYAAAYNKVSEDFIYRIKVYMDEIVREADVTFWKTDSNMPSTVKIPCIVSYNDALKTEKEDVIEMFDKGITKTTELLQEGDITNG